MWRIRNAREYWKARSRMKRAARAARTKKIHQEFRKKKKN
jgi:hypothetical protein